MDGVTVRKAAAILIHAGEFKENCVNLLEWVKWIKGVPLAFDRDEQKKLLKEKGVKSPEDFSAFMRAEE